MSTSDKLRILSPLLLFLFHVAYLVAWSKDPFLNKWIDGSFTFFVALVMCNVIRARVVARAEQPPPGDAGHDRQGPENDGAEP